MFKIVRKIYNQNRTYKKTKGFYTFEQAYQYADKYTRVTFSIYKIETEIFEDDVLVYTLDTDGNEKDMRAKEETKKEYVVYRGSKKLFTKDNLKDAQIYAEYWSKKDKTVYSVIASDCQEYVYEPPKKLIGWYIWQGGLKFKTLKQAMEYIANYNGDKKELDIYKIYEGDFFNDVYMKYKTVQVL